MPKDLSVAWHGRPGHDTKLERFATLCPPKGLSEGSSYCVVIHGRDARATIACPPVPSGFSLAAVSPRDTSPLCRKTEKSYTMSRKENRFMPWSVFLQDERLPLPGETMGRLVQQVVGGVVYDHTQQVNIHHGRVARGLEEGQADVLVELLRSSDLPALKKDEERLVRAEKRFRAHRALLLEDALHFPIGLTGELKAAPWSSVLVVSIGSVMFRERKEVRATRGNANIGLGIGLKIAASVATGIPIRMFPRRVKLQRASFKEVIEEAILVHIIFDRPH